MSTVWLLLCLFVAMNGGQPVQGTGTRENTRSNSRLAEIKVIGSRRFQPSELVRATGLTVGDESSEDALKNGADRLASSGMFSDVTYSFVSAPAGTKVEYKVSDTKKLLPAHFDNFVWLSDPELIAQLQEMEPLFRGEIPNAGNMYERLAADVKKVLEKLQVTADIKVFPEVSQSGGGVTGFIYEVEGVKLPIRRVEFAGVSPNLDAVLEKAAQSSLLGRDYSSSVVRSVETLDFLPEYHSRGFLRAEFGSPAASLANRSTGEVAVVLPVKEGLSYDLAAIRWSGNTIFPASELAKAVKVPLGKAANAVQLEDDLGGIVKVYGTRGYMEAQLQPRFTFDDDKRSVVADVEVREGDQYHMGDLQFEGLSEKPVDLLRKRWHLKTGDAYDTSYPQLFLASAAREFDFSHLSIQINQQPVRDSKVVNVTFHFVPK